VYVPFASARRSPVVAVSQAMRARYRGLIAGELDKGERRGPLFLRCPSHVL
jgi:hypothetical protein